MLLRTFITVLISFHTVFACTGILQKSEDGNWVNARTMEFGASLLSFDLLFVPRNIEQGGDKPGGSWKTKYAYTGFGPFGMKVVADGLNEKGLGAGAFYFPGWAEYQQVEQGKNSISNIDFISWVLGNFSTVQEVRDALKNTNVVGAELPAWGFVPPLHYFVADKTGDRIVIEYVKGKLSTYDTPIGTITNAPAYDWHLNNARNYIGLRALNNPAVKIRGLQLSQFGQGSGALGLPGDFTPPSRFIRAAFLNEVTLNGKDSSEQIERAFKILNQFDIPLGSVVDEDAQGKKHYEETQWTSASDLSNAKYYFHTAENREIQMVNLNVLDLDGKEVKTLSTKGPQQIQDLSSRFK